MKRYGTLLGLHGKPKDRVLIIRKGSKQTRVGFSTDNGQTWDLDGELVDAETVLEDNGVLWEKYQRTPDAATWLTFGKQPNGYLSVHRVHKHVIKAKVYEGGGRWSEITDFPPDQVLFDAGKAWPKEKTDKLAPTAEMREPKPLTTNTHHTGQRVSYIRVSTVDQNLARQREAIGSVDREFQDKISAWSRAERQGLEDCINYLRAGDQLVVGSIDRLARSLSDLQTLIDQICSKGASIHFVKEHLDFSAESRDPRASLMLGILGSFAEFERSIIRERQAEGIALAKKQGKYKGRKKALTSEQIEKARARIKEGQSKTSIAKELGVGRATLYRALDQQ